MPLAEEAIKQDPDPINEEAHKAVTTQTEITSIAISANYKDIGKRNAEGESTKTNPAEMHKDEPTGRESTSWTRRPQTKSVNAIYHTDNQMQDDDRELFNTSGVIFDRKYEPRTTALPQQNSGLQ
jgi:hypothetical protein